MSYASRRTARSVAARVLNPHAVNIKSKPTINDGMHAPPSHMRETSSGQAGQRPSGWHGWCGAWPQGRGMLQGCEHGGGCVPQGCGGSST
jgi:hypothetical protein